MAQIIPQTSLTNQVCPLKRRLCSSFILKFFSLWTLLGYLFYDYILSRLLKLINRVIMYAILIKIYFSIICNLVEKPEFIIGKKIKQISYLIDH